MFASVTCRFARVALVAAVVGLAGPAGSADARTIPMNWRDVQPLDGGQIVYRTTKIWIHSDTFSVSLSVTNRTTYSIRFFPSSGYDPVYRMPPGFGLAFRPPLQRGGTRARTLHTITAHTFSPSLLFPETLGIGKTWTGTFSGRSPLLRTHRTWWVTFGLAAPWKGKHAVSTWTGPHDTFWISDTSFTT
jgi:hypothetical protein